MGPRQAARTRGPVPSMAKSTRSSEALHTNALPQSSIQSLRRGEKCRSSSVWLAVFKSAKAQVDASSIAGRSQRAGPNVLPSWSCRVALPAPSQYPLLHRLAQPIEAATQALRALFSDIIHQAPVSVGVFCVSRACAVDQVRMTQGQPIGCSRFTHDLEDPINQAITA